jgi:hypothetical protein
MSWQVLLIAVAGMLPGEDAPRKAFDVSDPDTYFAKVEVQGSLRTAGRRPGEPITVEIGRIGMKPTRFPLDVTKLKGWTDKELERHNGKLVRVTGILEQRTLPTGKGKPGGQLVLLAETLEFRETDHSRPPPKFPRLVGAQFAKVEIQGELDTGRGRPGEPFWAGAAGVRFAVDISKLKGWTDGNFRTYCNGRTVRITGTLGLRTFNIGPSRPGAADGREEDRITVVAETLGFLEPDFVPPTIP